MKFFYITIAAVLMFAAGAVNAASAPASSTRAPDSALNALGVKQADLEALRAAGWPTREDDHRPLPNDGEGWNRPENRRFRERFGWFWLLPREWQWVIQWQISHRNHDHEGWHWELFRGWCCDCYCGWHWDRRSGWYWTMDHDWDWYRSYGWDWGIDFDWSFNGDHRDGWYPGHDRNWNPEPGRNWQRNHGRDGNRGERGPDGGWNSDPGGKDDQNRGKGGDQGQDPNDGSDRGRGQIKLPQELRSKVTEGKPK